MRPSVGEPFPAGGGESAEEIMLPPCWPLSAKSVSLSCHWARIGAASKSHGEKKSWSGRCERNKASTGPKWGSVPSPAAPRNLLSSPGLGHLGLPARDQVLSCQGLQPAFGAGDSPLSFFPPLSAWLSPLLACWRTHELVPSGTWGLQDRRKAWGWLLSPLQAWPSELWLGPG